MEIIDTLRAYKDLVNSGVPEEQAEVHALLLNNSLNNLATKNDLEKMLEKIEVNSKIFFGYIVGVTLFVAIIIPVLISLFFRYIGIS